MDVSNALRNVIVNQVRADKRIFVNLAVIGNLAELCFGTILQGGERGS